MPPGIWDYDCAIIGGGPGGLVSALYLKRFRRPVALVNSGKPRAAWIPRTRNLIGYDRGISGGLLLRRLDKQIGKLGVDRFDATAKVGKFRGGFVVSLGKQSITAKKIILATGIEDVQPDIKNVCELRKLGLLRYCSICDAYDYRAEHLAVLAQDISGVQKAFFLTQFTKKITVVIPGTFQISPQCQRGLRRAGIRMIQGPIRQIVPSRSPKGVWICVEGEKPLHARVAYVSLGCRVHDQGFSQLRGLRRSKDGFLIVTTEQRTSIDGLFAVGDCVNQVGQLAIAAGQAAVASTTLHNDLL